METSHIMKGRCSEMGTKENIGVSLAATAVVSLVGVVINNVLVAAQYKKMAQQITAGDLSSISMLRLRETDQT